MKHQCVIRTPNNEFQVYNASTWKKQKCSFYFIHVIRSDRYINIYQHRKVINNMKSN